MLRRSAAYNQVFRALSRRLIDEGDWGQFGSLASGPVRQLPVLTARPLSRFSIPTPTTFRPFSAEVNPKVEEEPTEWSGSHQSRESPASSSSSSSSGSSASSSWSGSSQSTQEDAKNKDFNSEESTSEAGGSGRERTEEGNAGSSGWQSFASGFKERMNGAEGSVPFKERVGNVAEVVWREVKDAVMPQEEVLSATRVRTNTVPFNEANSPNEIVMVNKTKSGWRGWFSKFSEQAEKTPLFNRVRGWTNQGKEFAEDIKDRLETSDHPMVHKIQDVQDRIFSEPETAQVMRQIRSREPNFDMVRFLKSVKEDVPVVIKAYLEGKQDVLKEHCTDEMSERLIGMYNHYAEQGSFQDPTLLFVSDVELFDATFVDEQPVLLVTFTCQQINCVRDRFSNVIEGKEDEIQQVYYAWAVQQDEAGEVDQNGNLLPPRWQLREMMIRLQHNLL